MDGSLESIFPNLPNIAFPNEIKTEFKDVLDVSQNTLRNKTQEDSADDHNDDSEAIRGEVFVPYEHQEWTTGCKPHPGNIVEPASLAAVQNSVCDYDIKSSLNATSISGGKLSSLQLEAIILAAQRHRIILPSGERAGFFIGDAAGVGKGRQIAGMIMDNYSRGRRKHVWFSVSTDLIVDAKRDLADIGCYINIIDGCQEIDKGTKLFGLSESLREGIVFSTYATLVSSVITGGIFNNSRKTRLQQVVEWCGGADFDGCLVFDECHKAKNFVPGNESASSKIALAVCSIQKQLPKARILYCSATGVTDVRNMAFMERLGLWGELSPFTSYQHFLETVQRKGLGIAEMLAIDMKRDGVYLSRMLSYSDAEFYNMECNLSEDQMLMYNMAAHIWNETRKSLDTAIHRCRLASTQARRIFWSAHQRFFQQLCMSVKVDAIVKEAKQALSEGKCVVIGLQNTGEASTDGKLARDKKVVGFVSNCREILLNYLTHFPIMIEQDLAANGPVSGPIFDDWSLRAKELLIEYTHKLQLPDSALDVLVDKLGGPKHVAEMTGRRGRIVRDHPTATPQYELRQNSISCSSDQSLNVEERNMFMSGKKLIAIISDAASTGISLHADRSCGNQRQRVHITMQLPWSADKAVQQLGRSHRSNQTSGPIYKLLTTELGGERRFAASVARRLQSLGALTKGDRRAATIADLSQFNYDTVYGRSALKLMYGSIIKAELPQSISVQDVCGGRFTKEELFQHLQGCLVTMGLISDVDMARGQTVNDNDQRDISRFLNRILGLQVVLQNMIFNYFVLCMELIVSGAKKDGRFNDGFVDLIGLSIQIQGEPKPVFTELCDGCNKVTLMVDRGMPWSAALERFETLANGNQLSGFYKTRYPMHGRHFYLLVTPKDNSHHYFKVARPNTGVGLQELDKNDLQQKYQHISIEEAVGKRKYRVNIVSGSLLRILPLLEEVMIRNASKFRLNKYESTVKVVRVRLDNGDRLIGFQYPELLMPIAESTARAMAIEKMSLVGKMLNNATEPIAPVVSKFLKKASLPPTTIKSYFTNVKSKESIDKMDNCKPAIICQPSAVGDDTSDDDIICLEDLTPSKRKNQASLEKFFTKKPKLITREYSWEEEEDLFIIDKP